MANELYNASCISFDSYIKPQPGMLLPISCTVVYLLIPTSNHNSVLLVKITSVVVYLLIPTSNHNLGLIAAYFGVLYIF